MSHILQQICFQLQVCLRMCDLFVTTGIKGLNVATPHRHGIPIHLSNTEKLGGLFSDVCVIHVSSSFSSIRPKDLKRFLKALSMCPV